MCKKSRVLFFALFVTLCCLVSGCGSSSSSPITKAPEQSQTKPSSSFSPQQIVDQLQPETSVSSESAQKEEAKKEDKSLLNGKPVTDDMLQSFRDSVTEDEMKLFIKVAKTNRYTESEVRDIAAKMKIVGIDFSLLKEGTISGLGGISFDMSSDYRGAEDYCVLRNCGIWVKTPKNDKKKVVSIHIIRKQQYGPAIPFYTLYNNDNIVGDFSDVLISQENIERIATTINEYVMSRGGQLIDNVGVSYTYITVTKDVFSHESKWKGGDQEKFSFPIIKSEPRYTEPSEVYGEKEKVRQSVFLFNKRGELLTVLHYPLPNEEQRTELVIQAAEKVKL